LITSNSAVNLATIAVPTVTSSPFEEVLKAVFAFHWLKPAAFG
jgi:hypothetical protein